MRDGRAKSEWPLLPTLRIVGFGALWIVAAWFAADTISFYVRQHHLGYDAHAYWVIAHGQSLYYQPLTAHDAYHYSPLFAQVTHPLALLPWPIFLGIWIVALVGAFAWLLRPLGWRWSVPLFAVCAPEICIGNVNALIAVAIVLSVRRPGFWAFPSLTKVAPGGLGNALVRRTRGVAAVRSGGRLGARPLRCVCSSVAIGLG